MCVRATFGKWICRKRLPEKGTAVESGTATRTITLQDSIQISEDAVFRELDGGVVILNLDTGIYFGLNPTGTRIWNLIAQHGSLQKAFETMTEEYEAPTESLENDILQLVGQLCEKGLVSASPHGTQQ